MQARLLFAALTLILSTNAEASSMVGGPALKEFVLPVKFRAKDAHDCRRVLRRLREGDVVDANGRSADEAKVCRRLFPAVGAVKQAEAQSECAIHVRKASDQVEIKLVYGLSEAECSVQCDEHPKNEKCSWRSAEEVAEDEADGGDPIPSAGARAKGE